MAPWYAAGSSDLEECQRIALEMPPTARIFWQSYASEGRKTVAQTEGYRRSSDDGCMGVGLEKGGYARALERVCHFYTFSTRRRHWGWSLSQIPQPFVTDFGDPEMVTEQLALFAGAGELWAKSALVLEDSRQPPPVAERVQRHEPLLRHAQTVLIW
jgi:hypothetical protein